MSRDIQESHKARAREQAHRLARVARLLPEMARMPPAIRVPEPPHVTDEQRAALERARLARAELEESTPPPVPKGPSVPEERKNSGPPPTEVWVPAHFEAEPVAVGKRELLRLRPELTAPGTALERFAGFLFERKDVEGYSDRTDPGECYLNLGRDPKRPAYELLVRLHAYGPSSLEKLRGGHKRKVERGRLVDALAGVGILNGTPDRFTSTGVIRGRPPIRGEGIIRAFSAKGYGIRPAGGHLLIELPGGHDSAGILPLLARPGARDLVHGWAADAAGIGVPRECEHPDHAGDPAPAVSVALADVLVCDACLAGRFDVAEPPADAA